MEAIDVGLSACPIEQHSTPFTVCSCGRYNIDVIKRNNRPLIRQIITDFCQTFGGWSANETV